MHTGLEATHEVVSEVFEDSEDLVVVKDLMLEILILATCSADFLAEDLVAADRERILTEKTSRLDLLSHLRSHFSVQLRNFHMKDYKR
jgi:hypothetical protein